MVLDWFYASPINEYFLLRVFSRIVLDESSLWLVDNESFLWLLLDLSSLMSSLIVCCRLAEWEGSSIHGISNWGPDSWGPGGSPKKIPPKGSHSLALKNCQVSYQFYHCWQSQDAKTLSDPYMDVFLSLWVHGNKHDSARSFVTHEC